MPILKKKKGLKSIIYSNQMSGKYGIMLRKGEKEVDGRTVANIFRFKGFTISIEGASQEVLVVKNSPADAGDIRDHVQPLGWEDPLEKSMATHPSVLAWRIPWTEESGRLQSMGLQRVGHD